jgi:auxin efflux carrier family protein
MDFWSGPQAFRLARHATVPDLTLMQNAAAFAPDVAGGDLMAAGHSAHPDFGHLVLLVFEAVLEVVCVSLPGYIIARLGMFNAEQQKFLANLNVQLFTPCLSTSAPQISLSASADANPSQSSPSSRRS